MQPASLVRFADDNLNIEPNVLTAYDGLNALLEQSEMQMIEEAQITQQSAKAMFQLMNQRFATLMAENEALQKQLIVAGSLREQQEISHQGEIAAVNLKADIAEKSMVDMRQEMAMLRQKAHAEAEATIKAQEEAIKLAVLTGDARVAALKQQILTSIDNMYLLEVYGNNPHKIGEQELRSMTWSSPRCSCHSRPKDPNSYQQKVFSVWGGTDHYRLENWTRRELAKVLLQQIETLKKIAS